ncbi:MAG: nucleoside triphosphate pyrophosphohydrolase [Candidatus Marinimicrobia bacterium]|nr:nucleoside triphosphate pyrophosphohydrolase [Candidatus Neomarinimicrobiota bacterium]
MTVGEKFEKLVQIVERLRGPGGCPWDQEQTHASLLPYFLEEAYEVIEAVDQENWSALREELGDIILHMVFQADIARQDSEFEMGAVLDDISAKMIRRHPHVFGDSGADAAFHAKQNWEATKHREKRRASRLDGVPVTLPALIRAQRLQEKASYVGFDWDQVDGIWDKIHEELAEVREAESGEIQANLEEEIGDLLFAVINLARFYKIPAEDALRKTNRKFTDRFRQIEEELKRRGKPIEEATLTEMDEIWERIKTEG